MWRAEQPMELRQAMAEVQHELDAMQPIPLPELCRRLRAAAAVVNGDKPCSKAELDRSEASLVVCWDLIVCAFPGIQIALDGAEVQVSFKGKAY